MHKLTKKISKLFDLGSSASKTEKDVEGDDDSMNYHKALAINRQPQKTSAEFTTPNCHYNDIKLFEAGDPVQCIKVIDKQRVAAGLDSGKVIIWDVLVGRQQRVLHNHQASIKLLEVFYCADGCPRLVSISKDELITIWNVDTGEMIKGFLLNENISVSLLHYVSALERTGLVTLLFGRTKLLLCHINIDNQLEPVHTQVIGRTHGASPVLELLETSEHIVCVADRSVDTFEKEWDSKGRLQLNHVDILSKHSAIFTCAALMSDDRVVVGTTYGGLFIYKLAERVEPDFYEPITSDACVKQLVVIDKEWLLVEYSDSIHIVHQDDGHSEYKRTFSHPLSIVRHIPVHNLLVTVVERSCKVLTWDLSNIIHDKKSWAKEEAQFLKFKGALVAHDSAIKGVEALADGLVTFADDGYVIVWRNRDEEIARLINAVQRMNSGLVEDKS